VTRKHWAINIRKFVAKAYDLQGLVALGSLTQQAADFLDAAIDSGLNIVASGATGAGKTTLLRCLARSIGARERVVTIEEVFELNLTLRDVVAMQTRQANLEGAGEISMRRLVNTSARERYETSVACGAGWIGSRHDDPRRPAPSPHARRRRRDDGTSPCRVWRSHR